MHAAKFFLPGALALTVALTGCAAPTEATDEHETVATSESGLATNCGITTCSVYLSRSETASAYNRINNYGWVAGAALGAALGSKGGPWGSVGGAIIGTFGAAHVIELLETATADNKCFKVTYVRGSEWSPTGPQITWLSTNNGDHCHD